MQPCQGFRARTRHSFAFPLHLLHSLSIAFLGEKGKVPRSKISSPLAPQEGLILRLPPASNVTIKRRVFVAIMEGKLELGSEVRVRVRVRKLRVQVMSPFCYMYFLFI